MSNTNVASLMALAQPGLYVEPGRHAHYLECHWPELMPLQRLKQALNEARQPLPNVYIALGFGASAWARMNPEFTPQELKAFKSLAGKNGHSMPATQGDIWFWIHGEDRGEVMAAVLQVAQAISSVLEIKQDKSGFKNAQSRDLLGFVDGTANPEDEERAEAAQIPLQQLGAGGSYVFTQRWRHNIAAFQQLALTEQERVFGRTREDDIEMSEDEMPLDSHVSRTDTGEDIYRRSTPYGGASEHGLYFLAFSCSLARIDRQLERMLGNADEHSDRMMDFTEAVTGSYWFMPAQNDLEALLKQ